MDHLAILAEEHEPDIILITESWCNDNVSDSMLNLDGYNLEPDLRVDRADTLNGIGGGLLVYTRKGIVIKPDNTSNEFNQYCKFQILFNDSQPLNVYLIYRSPNSTAENTNLLCDIIERADNNSLIIGDFNFPGINWELHTAENKCRPFLHCVENKFLTQMVDFSSHLKGNILDLALTDNPDIFNAIENLGNLSNSDHAIIQLEVNLETVKNKTDEMIRDWLHCDIDSFNSFIKLKDWKQSVHDKNACECWDMLVTDLETGMNKFVPLIPRRSNHSPIWLKNNVKKLCRKKNKLFKKFVNNPSEENREIYKTAEKLAKKAVKVGKKLLEKKLSTQSDTKPFYNYIKSKTKSKSSVGPLKINNNLVTDSQEIASALNNFFTSVFTNEDTSQIPVPDYLTSATILSNVQFTAEKISKKIKNLKPHTAPGPDGISAHVLQLFNDPISKILEVIFSKSISEGSVPEAWKIANITPIYKKGPKSSVTNYRPVSLTSIPCKIMESIIKDKVTSHLLDNHLLNPSQHGFTANKSCTTNLLEFLERITSEIDEGNPMDILYLDFSKAFDKVPRQRLLEKMKAHSIQGPLIKWFEAWLTGRRQRTVLNGKFSDWSDVLSGVPQGSVLGPLAFLIFINDLDKCANFITILKKFADDAKTGQVVANESDRQTLQTCLNELFNWSMRWGMEFNISKCKVLHVGRNNQGFNYSMNGEQLPVITQEKDLGVITHQSLKTHTQCAEASKKANKVLGHISRSFHYRDRHVFLGLYKQYVRCHLEYCSPVWSPCYIGDIELLENVQKRAVNMISGLKGQTYSEKLAELNLPSLEIRRLSQDLIQVFKIIKGFDRVDQSTWFQLQRENGGSGRSTRNSHPLNIVYKQHRTDVRGHFFSVRVIPKWNNLPNEIKDCLTVKSFKKALSDHLN